MCVKMNRFAIVDLPDYFSFKIIQGQLMEGARLMEQFQLSVKETDDLIKNSLNSKVGPYEFIKAVGIDFFFDAQCAEEKDACCSGCDCDQFKNYLK